MNNDVNFEVIPTKAISILLPTRNRGKLAFKSLQSLAELADHPNEIEFMVALDNDDAESADYFVNTVIPWFDEHDLSLVVHQVPRYGYLQLHQYNNYLGVRCTGSWIVFWNDDAVMETQGWDTTIVSHTGEFKILAFDTHNAHPYSIFPIIPRDWLILFEKLSIHQQTDAWVSQIAYLADCFERIPVKVLHDRADLTGNNDDITYKEREYREGNIQDPMDINSLGFHNQKLQWAVKVVWLRKLLGQDTGWWDSFRRGEVDVWQKMMDNDINNQIVITKVDQ